MVENRLEVGSPRSFTIRELQQMSIARSARWHAGGLTEWTSLEWTGAACGEGGETIGAAFELIALVAKVSQHLGEAANAAKKFRRVELGMANINTEPGRSLTDFETARKAVLKELADAVIYSVLAAACVDGNLEDAVREVFNQKSVEYGFPERL